MTATDAPIRSGKPNYLKLTEDFDFFRLFRLIEKKYDNCFLLESLGEESNVSRHHVIGFDPIKIISAPNPGTLQTMDTATGQCQTESVHNPYFELRRFVPNVISRSYAGGLVGYLAYDAINLFEPGLQVQDSDAFETFKFGLFLDGLIYDHVTGEIFYYYYDTCRFDEIQQLMGSEPDDFGKLEVEFLGHSMDRQAHAATVKKVKDDIVAGRLLQCEVGMRSDYRIEGDTLRIYERLRSVNPSPHMYYLKFGAQKIIGASPELLFRMRGGQMETFPLAGTERRGQSAAEDVQLARSLLNDPKEIAEHNMLVDLHRNDIGKVARIGSVRVRSLMDVKRFSHVQHISSEIVGMVADGEDMFSALSAHFPADKLTGAPKIEAIKVINELESSPRGPYGGALGQFSMNGDCAFAIPIRSVFIHGNLGYVQTCGGIVYDSVADNEYREIERKLSAMKNVLMEFSGSPTCVS